MEDNEYVSLIMRHFNKETSAEEEAGLHVWLEADPAHREEYLALERIWLDSGDRLNSRSFDEVAAWDKVRPRLMYKRPLVLRKMLTAAAILLLLAMGGWWFYTRVRQAPVRLAVAEKNDLHLTLPDGSEVWLRKGASLQFPQAFNGGDRAVILDGEAFFQPLHNPQKPFKIVAGLAIIEDVGTAFLVRETPYEGEIFVNAGKVKWRDKHDHSNEVLLSSGQKAVWKNHQLTLSATKSPNFMSWMTGILDFRDQPLDDVMKDINNYYHAKIALGPFLRPTAGTIKMTVRFDHQPLQDVLEEIRLTTGLQTVQEKDTLYFVRK